MLLVVTNKLTSQPSFIQTNYDEESIDASLIISTDYISPLSSSGFDHLFSPCEFE
jgi:hypothetical protein